MKRLLLHSCCAPCSGAIIECLLRDGLRPVVFFSNSNIVPEAEYRLRLSELKRYCDSLGVETAEDSYDHGDWLRSVLGPEGARSPLAKEPERGLRCAACFRYRLGRAAEFAKKEGFDTLTTTLASSRWKDLSQVDAAGEAACSGKGVEWWGRNWRKGGLQERRNAIIREQGFYNQTFCGCEFSRRESGRGGAAEPLQPGRTEHTPACSAGQQPSSDADPLEAAKKQTE